MLTVTKISLKYKNQIEEMWEEWEKVESCLEPVLNPESLSFSDYLKMIKNLESQSQFPMQFYLLLDKNQLIGYLELRFSQNDFNKEYAGHLGYAIRPSKRRLGYGLQALKKGIQELKKKKVKPIILTCDQDHQVSMKMFDQVNAKFVKMSHMEDEIKCIYQLD